MQLESRLLTFMHQWMHQHYSSQVVEGRFPQEYVLRCVSLYHQISYLDRSTKLSLNEFGIKVDVTSLPSRCAGSSLFEGSPFRDRCSGWRLHCAISEGSTPYALSLSLNVHIFLEGNVSRFNCHPARIYQGD